ncbi:MAG: hypothetical protein V4466_12025 [Pseudomonadota bacterium]
MADARQITHDLSTAAMKAAPPIGVTLWGWLGQNLPTAVALATLIYIIIQTVHLLWVWRRERRGKTPISRDPADE